MGDACKILGPGQTGGSNPPSSPHQRSSHAQPSILLPPDGSPSRALPHPQIGFGYVEPYKPHLHSGSIGGLGQMRETVTGGGFEAHQAAVQRQYGNQTGQFQVHYMEPTPFHGRPPPNTNPRVHDRRNRYRSEQAGMPGQQRHPDNPLRIRCEPPPPPPGHPLSPYYSTNIQSSRGEFITMQESVPTAQRPCDNLFELYHGSPRLAPGYEHIAYGPRQTESSTYPSTPARQRRSTNPPGMHYGSSRSHSAYAQSPFVSVQRGHGPHPANPIQQRPSDSALGTHYRTPPAPPGHSVSLYYPMDTQNSRDGFATNQETVPSPQNPSAIPPEAYYGSPMPSPRYPQSPYGSTQTGYGIHPATDGSLRSP